MRRLTDIAVSAVLLIVASPLLLLIAAAVWIDTGWPVLFRQTRAGLGLRPFTLLKFRSMRLRHDARSFTPGAHSSITRTGAFLRATKLDEIPQLWNVLRGDMSIVGSRPEVFEFVELHRGKFEFLLSVRPGLVDPASIEYFDEGDLLAAQSDPIAAYKHDILPHKLELSAQYLRDRNWATDVRLIAAVMRLCARKLVFQAGMSLNDEAAAPVSRE
jgi:lipopolysaccharide/colanic/teichoic acid biosynthesis glycosyltransferase